MAHTHGDSHGHGDVATREGYGAGLMIALATLVVLAVIAFALLWTQPWDDDDGGGTPNVPGVGDNSGGGTDGGSDGGGGTDGGGEAPAPAQ